MCVTNKQYTAILYLLPNVRLWQYWFYERSFILYSPYIVVPMDEISNKLGWNCNWSIVKSLTQSLSQLFTCVWPVHVSTEIQFPQNLYLSLFDRHSFSSKTFIKPILRSIGFYFGAYKILEKECNIIFLNKLLNSGHSIASSETVQPTKCLPQ